MAYLLIIVAILGLRLVNHPANFVPLLAIGLFAGRYLDAKKVALAVLVGMLASDLIIGVYSWPVMLVVYAALLPAVGLGKLVSRENWSNNAFALTGLASLVFFLSTNWAVWAFGTMYTANFAGLMQSYYMGLPFWRNQILADLTFTAALFSAYSLLSPVLKSKLTLDVRQAKTR